MSLTVISNTCVGVFTMRKLFEDKYNNPFISTLIPTDTDYLKLCVNIKNIIKYTPELYYPHSDKLFSIQNRGVWYKHSAIKIPYPVIKLDDIEIHAIHEDNNQEALSTFIRRLERMRSIIDISSTKIICTWSFSELINDHENIQILIDMFLENNTQNVVSLFAGPRYLYKDSYKDKFIIVDKWNNVPLVRDPSHIYIFNDQPFLINIFSEYIKDNIL